MHTPEATREEILKQYECAAMPNVHTAVEQLIWSSGIKDQVSQPLIAHLTRFGYKLQEKGSTNRTSMSEIRELLEAEYRKLKENGAIMSPLLDMKDESANIQDSLFS